MKINRKYYSWDSQYGVNKQRYHQNTCLLKDVLVSKQKISLLLDFDQVVHIYHENIVDKFPLKIPLKSVRAKVLIKSFRIFKKFFIPILPLLFISRQYLIHLLWTVCNLFLNFWFRFGCQAEQAYSKYGWIRALHKSRFIYCVKYLFFL